MNPMTEIFGTPYTNRASTNARATNSAAPAAPKVPQKIDIVEIKHQISLLKADYKNIQALKKLCELMVYNFDQWELDWDEASPDRQTAKSLVRDFLAALDCRFKTKDYEELKALLISDKFNNQTMPFYMFLYSQSFLLTIKDRESIIQTPSQLIKNGYGECDDLAVFFTDIFRSKGIEAYLIKMGTTGQISKNFHAACFFQVGGKWQAMDNFKFYAVDAQDHLKLLAAAFPQMKKARVADFNRWRNGTKEWDEFEDMWTYYYFYIQTSEGPALLGESLKEQEEKFFSKK